MSILFEIETGFMFLRWSGPSRKSVIGEPPAGILRIYPEQTDLNPQIRLFKSGEHHIRPAEEIRGPALYEETSYRVTISPKDSSQITIHNRDPILVGDSDPGPNGEVFVNANFRSQVGFSRFQIRVDGRPKFSFEVEVFPTKIDYKADYEAMLAEITDFFMGLAMEYLRSTYRPGALVTTPEPSQIEWLTILRQVLNNLSVALRRIAYQPNRRLIRVTQQTRPDKIRRVDNRVRRAVARGQGRGRLMPVPVIGMVREYVVENRPAESLDTPEHRWIRAQLLDIQYRLAALKNAELQRYSDGRFMRSRRTRTIVNELGTFQSEIQRLLNLEPFSEASGDPPPSFSSLVLQASPGYREAYITCLILRLGLKIEGGPFELSLKDISALYEYWCYLGVLRLTAEQLGRPLDPGSLLTVTSDGLRVDLERSRTEGVTLEGRRRNRPTPVKVHYNPTFRSSTGAQRPDIGLAINIEGWKNAFEIILDAKYRLDSSPNYTRRHGSPGPPDDAVNALHRYRDAILACRRQPISSDDSPKRRVIVGAALFPFDDSQKEYKEHTFHRSLDEVGIGALPFLPGQVEYVRAWLKKVLTMGGWSLTELAPQHISSLERDSWRRDASSPVLVAVLRPGVNHLRWIMRERQYYAPLDRLGRRRFAVQAIAFYQAGRARKGAITHVAEVRAIDVKPRREIRTPWPTGRSGSDLQIVYSLNALEELEEAIPVAHMRSFRWASRLSLRRARTGRELFLETAPEWQLYEELSMRQLEFDIAPGAARIMDPDDPKGRTVFKIGDWTVRHAGTSGFRASRLRGKTMYLPTVKDVLRAIPGEATDDQN